MKIRGMEKDIKKMMYYRKTKQMDSSLCYLFIYLFIYFIYLFTIHRLIMKYVHVLINEKIFLTNNLRK